MNNNHQHFLDVRDLWTCLPDLVIGNGTLLANVDWVNCLIWAQIQDGISRHDAHVLWKIDDSGRDKRVAGSRFGSSFQLLSESYFSVGFCTWSFYMSDVDLWLALSWVLLQGSNWGKFCAAWLIPTHISFFVTCVVGALVATIFGNFGRCPGWQFQMRIHNQCCLLLFFTRLFWRIVRVDVVFERDIYSFLLAWMLDRWWRQPSWVVHEVFHSFVLTCHFLVFIFHFIFVNFKPFLGFWGFASVGVGFFAIAWVFNALKGRV